MKAATSALKRLWGALVSALLIDDETLTPTPHARTEADRPDATTEAALLLATRAPFAAMPFYTATLEHARRRRMTETEAAKLVEQIRATHPDAEHVVAVTDGREEVELAGEWTVYLKDSASGINAYYITPEEYADDLRARGITATRGIARP